MHLINNSRFSVGYTVTPSTSSPYKGSMPGGGDAEISQPTFTVAGDAGQLGRASAENVPSNATVTFTVENSVLHMQVKYAS